MSRKLFCRRLPRLVLQKSTGPSTPYSRNGRVPRREPVGRSRPWRRSPEALSIAPSSVVKWSQRKRATGSAAPGKIGGHRPRKIQGEHAAWLRARMTEAAFTLRGLVAELAERGLRVDYHTMWNFSHSEGLSFKKTALASGQNRPNVACRCAFSVLLSVTFATSVFSVQVSKQDRPDHQKARVFRPPYLGDFGQRCKTQ